MGRLLERGEEEKEKNGGEGERRLERGREERWEGEEERESDGRERCAWKLLLPAAAWRGRGGGEREREREERRLKEGGVEILGFDFLVC